MIRWGRESKTELPFVYLGNMKINEKSVAIYRFDIPATFKTIVSWLPHEVLFFFFNFMGSCRHFDSALGFFIIKLYVKITLHT